MQNLAMSHTSPVTSHGMSVQTCAFLVLYWGVCDWCTLNSLLLFRLLLAPFLAVPNVDFDPIYSDRVFRGNESTSASPPCTSNGYA